MEKLQTKQNSCSGGGGPGYGHAGGGGQGLAGYSNIPLLQSNVGLFNGNTCGTMQYFRLSPNFQSSVGHGDGMAMYQLQLLPPSQLGIRPAYCFHCLQFGSGLTVNQG